MTVQLRLPVRWDDHRYWLTECLLRREPIEPFGGGIPTGNRSIEVFSNNGIIGMFDDCCQSLGVFLGASYLCGVAKNQDDAENLADLIFDWAALSSIGRSLPPREIKTV